MKKSNKKILDLVGYPSGEILEITDFELYNLKQEKLVYFVAFSEDYMNIKYIPIYSYFYEDKDREKIMNILTELFFK